MYVTDPQFTGHICDCCNNASAEWRITFPTDANQRGTELCDQCVTATSADVERIADLTETTSELPIDALTECDPATVGRGDTVAYVLSKTYPEQVWRPCRVIANDPQARLLVIACDDKRWGGDRVSTLEWHRDSVAQWPVNHDTDIY